MPAQTTPVSKSLRNKDSDAASDREQNGKAGSYLSQNSASAWCPIGTAPKDGTSILLCLWAEPDPFGSARTAEMVVAGYDAANPGFPWLTLDGTTGYHADAPTHWMPLPEPPQ